MTESDPENRRWSDTAALGGWLTKYERPRDRVAVTRFTSEALSGPIVAPSSLGVEPRALAPEPPGSGTAFMPVVQAARQVFSGRSRAYFRVLILLTDGDASDSGEAIKVLPTVADRVFVVALDRGSAWDRARKAWEEGGFTVTKLGNEAPNEIGAALAGAVMKATGQTAR